MKNQAIFLILPVVLTASVFANTTSPANKEAEQHFEKANELLKRMDYEGAIAEYNKVIDLSSGSKAALDAQYWIGQSLFRAGRLDDAKVTFAKLIEQYPSSSIIPVTKLMVERVEQAKKNEEKRRAISIAADNGFIIDPNTGVKYSKSTAFAGKNDVIEYTTDLNLSPNGKFLLYGKLVVPIDGSEPFELVQTPAYRGTWSPDGKKVAFYSGDAICVVPVSPETGRAMGPVKKLLDGEYNFQPNVSWSPDSEKLAFMRGPDQEKQIYGGDIWTVSVEDSSLTQITSDRDAREGAPAWSPDGKTIAYGKRIGRNYSLWSTPAEGGEPAKIALRRARGFRFRPFPHWSPDGKWILCAESDKIHLFDIHGGRRLRVIPPREAGSFFDWSSDGKKILFYRPSYDYKYGIKVVSITGGPPFDLGRQITLYPEHQWSPDNKIIVAGGENKNGRYGLWLSPLSDDESALLEIEISVDGSPFPISVSPNGEKVALSVKRNNRTEDLFVAPISLQDARTMGPAIKVFDGLSRESGTNVTTSWSPDGNQIAVIHRGNVWIASSNGDKPLQITETPEMEIWPGWSPDGRMISYVAGSERSFYVRPVSGEGQATKIAGADHTSVWSPDSKQLVIQSEGKISIVSVADGETRQIAKLNDLGLERVFYFSWSPDGKYIAFVGKHIEKGDAGPIFLIPAEGGKPTTLVTNDNSCKYLLHWSPDGRWISYNSEGPAKVRPEGTLWEADFDEILKKASR
jgi:Tol biopolymer transport system component